MAQSPKRTSRERMRAYRDRLRAQGLRPVTYWLPDTSTADFLARAEKEALAVAAADDEAEIMAFIESVQDWPADEKVFWTRPAGGADAS